MNDNNFYPSAEQSSAKCWLGLQLYLTAKKKWIFAKCSQNFRGYSKITAPFIFIWKIFFFFFFFFQVENFFNPSPALGRCKGKEIPIPQLGVLTPIKFCVKWYGMHQCFFSRSRFTPCTSMEGELSVMGGCQFSYTGTRHPRGVGKVSTFMHQWCGVQSILYAADDESPWFVGGKLLAIKLFFFFSLIVKMRWKIMMDGLWEMMTASVQRLMMTM